MLLCVSGAIVMIIIGDSVARAFGIAGAASIIRFRTPVEDPKDITILFLLMGLGMAAGLGAFGVAGLATAFLCVLLLALDRLPSDQRPREMVVELVAEGRDFPVVHVESVFARNGVIFEPRDVSQGKDAAVKYHVSMDPAGRSRRCAQAVFERRVRAGRPGDAGVRARARRLRRCRRAAQPLIRWARCCSPSC